MSDSNPKFIHLDLKIDHPELLTGLDALLRLGLLSDAKVRQLGRSQLSCRLPDPLVITEAVAPKSIEEPVFVLKIPTTPTILSRFLDELSVRWLLFLGVFLVVLSSGVLVASQWSNFPAVGQYLVLWSYTVVFGLVGFWAAGQQELKLTSQTLQAVAMLLVLLNFWAVDEFNIWQSIWQSWVAIAAIFLLSLGVSLFTKNRRWSKPMFGVFLTLGLVHWGWDHVLNPVAGVYLGIGTVVVLLWGVPLFAKRSHPQKVPESVEDRLGLEFVLFGLGLLLFRAIAVAGVPMGALGLGLGALGWLLTELERDKFRQSSTEPNSQTSTEAIAHPWEAAGASLLLLGWLVTVGRYDWQVLGVSALAVAWLLQKLRRDWLVIDLVALFVVGLQGGILCREVVPSGLKTSVTTAAVEFSQAQAFPYSIYSVTLLPYLLIWAIAAVWFYRQNKLELARTSEYLLLGLGIILAGLSVSNPTWRSLNFMISAGVWFYFTEYSRPYLRQNYLYLSHGMALLALGGIIERIFPSLGFVIWGTICLVGLLIEWSFCLLPTTNKAHQTWQKSSWHYGLCLAITSFILLLIAPLEMGNNIRLIWLIAPSAATFLAYKKKRTWRREAATFSICGLICLPLFGAATNGLAFFSTATLQTNLEAILHFIQICLAIATGLMLVNVRLMPSKLIVHLHLGFGTALIISLLSLRITDWQWLIGGAMGSGIFWGLAAILQPKRHYLGRLYQKTCHQWGLVCAGLIALILLQNSLETWKTIGYYWAETTHPEILVSSGLLFIIILTKYWQNPQNEALVIGGIALETVVIENCILSGADPVEIAIRNLCLASIFFFAQKKIGQLQQCSLWQAYPLLFTFLSFAWRIGAFYAFTGLLMIYLGLLFFACATLYQKVGFLRFLGFASITFGFYETVIYQMLRSSGGNMGDGLTIFAFVAIGLALIYRSLYWLRSAKGAEKIASIPLKEILIAAHVHWAIAALFKLLTLPYFQTEPPNLKIMAIAINICLAIYAFIQANNQTQKTTSKWSEWWIYVGAIELIATSIQARWMWQQLETLDPFRALLVSLLALMIFQLPWTNMGWQEAPWHRVGIAMPALCLVMTASSEVSYLSLASVTLVYLRLAHLQKNVRWGYLSLIFGNWLIGKILFQFGLLQPLSYALQIGLSILLIAQIDPDFQGGKGRSTRHLWRLIGSGIICVIALINYQEFGITPAIISLVFIFLGLGLQIRAFLYNGTIILMMTGIYQLVILIDNHSFTKWVIGLIAGILLISIAANFEQRRLQIIKILQNWVETLNDWQ